MKLFLFSLLFFAFTYKALAQVGIGTDTPSSSAMLEISSTTKGFLLPRMTSTQRVAIASVASGLQVYDSTTNSIWYYNGTFWVNTQAMGVVGDVKSGVQATDHSGWVKLDGRSVSSLTTSQKTAASSLGYASGNLPNASNTYLSQNGAALGSISGANTSTISQNNLPNVNFTASIASAGSHNHYIYQSSNGYTGTAGNHTHNVSPASSATAYSWGIGGGSAGFTIAGSITSSSSGDHNHNVTIPAANTADNGSHAHTATVNSGGSGVALNIAPATLSINMFIYLGL